MPVSSRCVHFPNCRAKHSTSPEAMPSRFIPVSIFKWKGTGFLLPRRAPARLSNANCSQRWITAVRSCSTSRDSSPGTKLVSTRIGFRTPFWRTAMPSSVQVTPKQSEPAFSSAFATSGPPWPYPLPFTMERILRGDLRFSCGGFTYLRIASRLYASAPSETSAHTGRRTSLRGLFCVPAMGLPNKIVYAIRAASARRQLRCRVNDNTPCSANWWPFALASHGPGSDVFYGEYFFFFTDLSLKYDILNVVENYVWSAGACSRFSFLDSHSRSS